MKYIQLLLWLFVFMLLAIFLQTTNAFHFFYIEQFQLFRFSWPYFSDRVADPGGLSVLIGEFFVQFFSRPYAGAVITAALLTIVGLLTRAIIKRICSSYELFGLYLLPVITLLLMHFNFNYFMQGTIAYILLLLFFLAYSRISEFRFRLPAGLIFIPFLFWWAGSITVLFVVCILLWELFKRPARAYLILFAVLACFILVAGSIYYAFIPEYRFAILPDAFFLPTLTPPFVIYWSWICLPLVLIITFMLSKQGITSVKKKTAGWIVQSLCLLALCIGLIPSYNDTKSVKLKELDYYARTQNWDKLIRAGEGSLNNFMYLGYLNMALIEKGELAERMFFFDQHGLEGLILTTDKAFAASNLLSEIYFTLGEVALSQQMAFEAYVTVNGYGNPRNLKRLVQTNLIYGEYKVAEKYIRLLEKTYGYAGWAKDHRKYLYKDAAVEADPLLGGKRKLLPAESKSTLTGLMSIENSLLSRVERDPADNQALHLLGAIYLLTKNTAAFREMIETYYATEARSTLPYSFQEAVILLEDRNPEYWKRFNVSQHIIDRFTGYGRVVMQNRNNPNALPQLLSVEYSNTYWYYFIYK